MIKEVVPRIKVSLMGVNEGRKADIRSIQEAGLKVVGSGGLVSGRGNVSIRSF